ncbi:MAG TPA: hypothetical protein PKN54_08430, partial [Candidatus Cloacimonas acidaminovorans]|nr:hypothetical protein [Candidatus Cloacimonas acidaminovorans]
MSEIDKIVDKVNVALKDTGFSVCEFGKQSHKKSICISSFKTKIKTENIILILNRCTNIENKKGVVEMSAIEILNIWVS